jgi:uncharacterized protein
LEKKDLPPFFSRESTIRRDAFGTWYHEGVAVENEAIARAFDRWIDVAEDGRYRLKNAINWVYVEIEGAPIIVRTVDFEGDRVSLHLSDATIEQLRPETLRQDRHGALYCDVRNGTLPAQFSRAAHALLAPLVGEEDGRPYLEIGGARVMPPIVDEPLRSRSA